MKFEKLEKKTVGGAGREGGGKKILQVLYFHLKAFKHGYHI